VLRGQVSSYYQKQLAQETVRLSDELFKCSTGVSRKNWFPPPFRTVETAEPRGFDCRIPAAVLLRPSVK